MKVSVVIPCHNAERHLEAAVRSALAQDHPVKEVICVDDGSTDGTLALARRLESAHPGIVKAMAQPNAGASAARSRGLEAATGELVQFLDADDTLLPGKIGHQVRIAEACGSPGVVAGAYRVMGPDGPLRETFPLDEGDPWKALFLGRSGITSANLWSREAVLAVGGWNEEWRSSQEYELMFRLLRAGHRMVMDTAIHTEVHKHREGRITRGDQPGNKLRFALLRAQVIEHLEREGTPYDRQAFLQFLFDATRALYRHDPTAALDFHARHIPADFRPTRSPATGGFYLVLHRLLGFRGAERVRDLTRTGTAR